MFSLSLVFKFMSQILRYTCTQRMHRGICYGCVCLSVCDKRDVLSKRLNAQAVFSTQAIEDAWWQFVCFVYFIRQALVNIYTGSSWVYFTATPSWLVSCRQFYFSVSVYFAHRAGAPRQESIKTVMAQYCANVTSQSSADSGIRNVFRPLTVTLWPWTSNLT